MSHYDGPSISLHVKITIAPENVQNFISYFKPIYDVVAAEPECIFFEVYQNSAAPGEFKWVENWVQSVEWLQNVTSLAWKREGGGSLEANVGVGPVAERVLQAIFCRDGTNVHQAEGV
jgi:hypothetical protein